MNILLPLLAIFIGLVIYTIHKKSKRVKYEKRKEYDQRYNTGSRKGVDW